MHLKHKGQETWLVWYLLALEAIHLMLPLNWSDDRVFMETASQTQLADFLATKSRLIIDTLTLFFARNPLVWRLLNPLVIAGLALMLISLMQINRTKQKIALSLLILVPSMVLVDAGFMATTLNYLWPFAAGTFVVWAIASEKLTGKRRVVALCAAIPAALLAANMQQMAVVLLAVLVLLAGAALYKRNYRKAILVGVYVLVAAASAFVVFYRSFAGDNARFFRESARYFPDFAQLSVWQRLELGFSTTFYGMTSFSPPALVWAAACVFVCICIIRRFSSPFWKLLSTVPLVMTLFLFFVQTFGANSWIGAILQPSQNFLVSQAQYHFSPAADALYLLTAILFLILLLRLISTTSARLCAVMTLGIGFGARAMMGFSPTVWASGFRTFFPLVMSLLIVCFLAYNTEPKTTPER